MYNLCFVAQVKTMYKEKCEEEDEIEEERKQRAGIKVFGEEPPQAESIEFEEEIVQEEE